jgi:predicted transcriptional regulator
MFKVFARPKPCRILTLLRDQDSAWHLSRIAKGSDTTYVYVTGLVSNLQKAGLVTVEAKGKKRVVRLTERGMRVAKSIEDLKNSLEG